MPKRQGDQRQLGLFAPDALPEPLSKGGRGRTRQDVTSPTPLADDVTHAAALPPNVHLGTSSWSFPGWNGLVYDGAYSQGILAKRGLAAYAQHPLFRTVGIDRTYYRPIPTKAFAEYADMVPEGFRFLAKAPEDCTALRFPKHARYGDRKGQANTRWLDPTWATEYFVAPFAEGLGAKAGPLLFQFPPQQTRDLGPPEAFADHLHRFLRSLPQGPLYAVELRNPELLTTRYREALQDVNAVHCANAWGWMPPPSTQLELTENKSRALVIRWMLRSDLNFSQAKERYSPFTRIVDADPTRRADIARLISNAIDEGLPVWVIVNNKAEGCAPLSISELARAIAGLRRGHA